MPTLDSVLDHPDTPGYVGDITFDGNMVGNPFVVVKNNKRIRTGQQRMEDLSYNNTLATVYMEPHVGIICSSCNVQDKIYLDADSHSRSCIDRRAHIRLSNGFIYENKVGNDSDDGTRLFPKPFSLTGQDYRNIRDLCGISSDLINRQEPYWTPSMPILESKGNLKYKSYRWHYTFMSKMVNLSTQEWGMPSHIYGVRHEAIVRANSAQTNITEEISNVEDGIAAAVAAGAALNAAEQEIAQLKSQKAAGKAKRTGLRKVANEARAALESTKALLDRANERLVLAGCEEVTAKVAPTADGAAANGRSAETSTHFSDSDPRNVTQSCSSSEGEEQEEEQEEDN